MNPTCVHCQREMLCFKTGAVIRAGIGHYYSGDMFHCPDCDAKVIVGMGNPYHSEEEIHIHVDLVPKEQRCLFVSC